MSHEQFFNYIESAFFQKDPSGFSAFREKLRRPIGKTLRINLAKTALERFQQDVGPGWHLRETNNDRVFRVDRDDTTTPLGSTLEHLRGDFYIQELSASMSVQHLADGKSHSEWLRILDMAASPGGKTTQLAEHYPNAFILANEFGKTRLNALIENVERMGCENVAVSNRNGAEFAKYSEMFDLVLLDAPCSGEGIAFKAEESLKYWNLKNIKTIARLQSKLLFSGLAALVPGGTLLYSTCTLNEFENEGVLNDAKERFGDAIEVTFAKRFWPHLEESGGFFIAKIEKRRSFENEAQKTSREIRNREILPFSAKDRSVFEKACASLGAEEYRSPDCRYFRYKNDVLLVRSQADIDAVIESSYLIRLGKRIGRFDGDSFVPNHFFGADRILSKAPRYDLDESEVGRYLRGEPIPAKNGFPPDWFIQLFAKNRPLSLTTISNGTIGNSWPKNFLRR